MLLLNGSCQEGAGCILCSSCYPMPLCVCLLAPQSPGTGVTVNYTRAGVYAVCARVRDHSGQGASHCCNFLVVVYDVNDGAVSGSGAIQSPPGAYRPNVAITGPANFAFQSRYSPGKNIPDGTTMFTFQAASFQFSSTVYE